MKVIRVLGVSVILLLPMACGSTTTGTTDGVDDATTGTTDGVDDGTTGNQDPEAPAGFTVQNDSAMMIGVIGSSTPDAVRNLVNNNPQVTTIVMVDVPGSEDDVSNLEASRLVRQAGLNTHIQAGAGVASGGTDFFLAGVVRTMDAGAIVGVHSWATGGPNPVQGATLKNNDPDWATNPDHTLFTDYYAELGLADPAGFYCFTLDAAPADDIHNMTTEEKNRFGLCSPDPCPGEATGGADASGTTLIAAQDESVDNPMLFTIDPTTANATAVGAINFPVNGLAVAPDGTLFGVTSVDPRQLITINRTSGAGTVVAPLTEGGAATGIEDIAFIGNRLVGWVQLGFSTLPNGNQYAVEIDTTTGEATSLGDARVVMRGGGISNGGANIPDLGVDIVNLAGDGTDDGGQTFASEFDQFLGDTLNGSLLRGDAMMNNNGFITAMSHFQGTLFLVDGGGTNDTPRLGTVDPTMGQFALVGDLPAGTRAIAGSVK